MDAGDLLQGADRVEVTFKGPGGQFSALRCEAFGWRVFDERGRYVKCVVDDIPSAEEAIATARRLANQPPEPSPLIRPIKKVRR